MQFTVDAGALLQALKAVKAGLFSHPESTSPYVLIQAQRRKVTLTTFCSTMRVAVTITGAVTIGQEGEHMVLHQRLEEALKAFHGPITIRREAQAVIVSSEGQQLHRTPVAGKEINDHLAFSLVDTEGATYTRTEWMQRKCAACNHQHSEQLISVYQIVAVEKQRICLAQRSLAALVKRVAWAAAEYDYGRPVFTGVYAELANDRFTLIAADGFCVALCPHTLSGAGSWEHGVLVSAELLRRAIRAIPKGTDILVEATFTHHRLIKTNDMEVSDAAPFVRATALHLTAGDVMVTLSLMNEKPPEYRSVVPGSFETRVVCSRADLLRAAEAVAPVAADESSTVRLHIGSSIKVEAEYHPLPALHEVAVDGKEGPDISTLLNYRYLLSALKAMDSSQVVLECTAPEKPLALRSFGNQDVYLCVLMPKSEKR